MTAHGYVAPGFDQLFVVPATGGAARQLTFGAFHHGGSLDWTRDGRAILLSADRSEDWERSGRDGEIYRLDVSSGGLTPLTSRDGPRRDAAPVARWTAHRLPWL